MIATRPITWESRLDSLYTNNFRTQQKNEKLAMHTRSGTKKELFELVSEEYGEQKAFDYMNFMNEKAPLTIRVNTLKVQRNQL